MTLLTDAEAQRVAQTITDIERNTDAELVTVLAKQTDDYYYIPALWAALIALVSPGLVLLTPFWLEVTEVLFVQAGVFLVMLLLLRIPTIMQRIIPQSVKQWRASNMAHRQFLQNNLHHTDGATGVLIFVAETEHFVQIIADRGIDQHVDPEQWQSIVDGFTQEVRAGNVANGLTSAIEACGALLVQHVPKTHERNELPNHLILI